MYLPTLSILYSTYIHSYLIYPLFLPTYIATLSILYSTYVPTYLPTLSILYSYLQSFTLHNLHSIIATYSYFLQGNLLITFCVCLIYIFALLLL